ncbi:MAG: hypothetical protein JSU63_01530 [Phycisphaerales bacterium]|nr:MAG: hypothetical protein JSU63_01530 [Phycisphaerales bacterium]
MNRGGLSVHLGIILWLGVTMAFADTGSYEIPEYHVTLTPREDGKTEISYYQKWLVTGGHIPWVTVGMANSAFIILKNRTGGNVSRIRSDNSRGWWGVRISLDRDYQPGETFEVEFAVLQGRLFYAEDDDYRLEFTPGWYDRATIGQLTVGLEFFADLEGVAASPEADQVEPRRLTWERSDLSRGGRLQLGAVFPRELFPGEIQLAQRSRSEFGYVAIMVIVVVSVVVVVALAMIASRGTGKGYGSGGRLGMGGIGHGIDGCVISCACACVACACACACAGGGAAGCDRKLTRACPLCTTCERTDCPLRLEPSYARTSTMGRCL